jgi:hypothetical protein
LQKGKLKSNSVIVISIILTILSINILISTKVSGSSVITNEYYLENFDDLSSSNSHINMTTENDDLQLNYSVIPHTSYIPLQYPTFDNWTEDLSFVGSWSIFLTGSGVPVLDTINFIFNNKSVLIPNVIAAWNPAPLPASSMIAALDLSSNPINIRNYETFIWFYMDNLPIFGPDALILTELRFTDSNNNYTSIYPQRHISPMFWAGMFGKYAEDLSDFIDSDGDSTPFDWSSVEYIEWGFQLTTVILVGVPFNMWFDGLGFEDNYNEIVHRDTGVWYSENISIPANKSASSLSYDGTNLATSSISVSDDNATWLSVGTTYTNLSNYNLTNNVFIKVEMTKLSPCITPMIDYLLLEFETVPEEPIDLPPDYTLFWVLILVGSISGAVLASVLGTRQVYKSMRIKRMKF